MAARKAPPPGSPYAPVEFTKADAFAVQALFRGEAGEHEQRRALKWIIENACATYDMSYRPGGEDGRRDTDFAEGRRFVGNQIIKLTKINVGQLKDSE